MRHLVLACLSTLAPTVVAQDRVADGAALLERTCAAMRSLASGAFTSIAETDDAMTRMLRGRLPADVVLGGETELQGGFAGEVRWASLNLKEDEVVCRLGRTVSRHEEGAWHPRNDSLENGTPAPFVFDPELFFGTLERIPAAHRSAVRQDAVEWRERPIALLGLTLEGDAARDLVLGGALPSLGGGPVRGMTIIGGGGGRPPRTEAPELTVDLALWVEPASGHVLRMKANAYQETTGGRAGNVQIEIGGAGVLAPPAEEAEAEVEEFDAEGQRRYEGGLPVRKVGSGTSVSRFDVRFDRFGEAEMPELGAAARAHLGLGSK